MEIDDLTFGVIEDEGDPVEPPILEPMGDLDDGIEPVMPEDEPDEFEGDDE